MYLRQAGLTCSSKFVIFIPFGVGDRTQFQIPARSQILALSASRPVDMLMKNKLSKNWFQSQRLRWLTVFAAIHFQTLIEQVPSQLLRQAKITSNFVAKLATIFAETQFQTTLRLVLIRFRPSSR
jgi:hypothetical protein